MKLKQEIINLCTKAETDICVQVDNQAEWSEAVAVFANSGIKASPYDDELTFSGQKYVKFGRYVGWYWTSNYKESPVLTFEEFKSTMCEVPVEIKLPKLYDKQVLKLAALIGVQDSLVEQLKANGAAIKALKAEMGVQ